MTQNVRDLRALVRDCSPEDFALLAACVQERLHEDGDGPLKATDGGLDRMGRVKGTTPRALPPFAVGVPHADAAALERMDLACAERVTQARNAQQRLSRLRVWLVFTLLRHAGLRLSEALAFDDARDLCGGILRVGGTHAREIPLSVTALDRLREILDAPESQTLRGELARLDEGYLRRCLYARARECAVEPGLVSARALRTARAIELCRAGMPLKIVHAFLGQSSSDPTAALLHYGAEDANAIINYYLHREARMKTSARNVFPGKVRVLRHSGILVEVVLRTFTGLDVVAVITEESCLTLALEEGKTAIATVKAPWVILTLPAGAAAGLADDKGSAGMEALVREPATSARNRFAGVIAGVRRSEVATEVLVDLPEGSRVCSLITTESADALHLEEGKAVLVSFKAFSVILALE